MELEEGRLTVVPPATPWHMEAAFVMTSALRDAVPPELKVYLEVGVNLELAPVDQPATVRIPDVVVVRAEAAERVRAEGGIFRASDVLLVVEVLSPSSLRTDQIVKRDEYADAGIPNYWIVDIREPASVKTFHQAGEFGYADGGEATGVFRTEEPFPFELDLNRLR
jgi:Uma2 family endonuclease